MKFATKAFTDPLYLVGYSPGRILDGPEEHVDQDIHTLAAEEVGEGSGKHPPREAEHLGKKVFLENEAVPALCEIPFAIGGIDHSDNDCYGKQQECVEDQFVKRQVYEQENDRQLERNFRDRNVGEDFHSLVGDDHCIIRDADDRNGQSQDRKLVNPQCCVYAFCRDFQLGVDEP